MDVYDHAHALPQTLLGTMPISTYRDLRRHGLTDTGLRWRTSRRMLARPHRGVYLRTGQPPDLLDRIRAALAAITPAAGAMVGFHTAAALLGFGVLESPAIHVVVAAGAPFPQRPGIVAHQATLPVKEPWHIAGIPCVPPDRCAVDLARRVRRLNAIAVLDAAVSAGACSVASLTAEAHRHRGLRGVREVRELVRLADGRAECRQESQLRLVLHDGGVIGFEPQLRVYDEDGISYCRLDLGDARHRVGAEYDGASHLSRDRHRADRSRHNWLSAQGWAMRYFTDRDLYRRPSYIVQTVRAAQNR